MNRKILFQAICISVLLICASLVQGVNNPSGVSLEIVPERAKNGDMVTVKVNIIGSSETISFETTNLIYQRGYHHHCGFCNNEDEEDLCLTEDDDIRSCTDLCYSGSFDGIGCEYSVNNEFSSSWFGGPTLEYEIQGCDIATITPVYKDGSHGGPYTLKPEEIVIVDGIEADFWTPSPVCAGEEVQFENLSCGGDTYSWSFGDGGGSTAEVPRHVFETSGTYSVSLTTSSDYDSDTETKEVEVRDDCAIIQGTVLESGSDSDGLPDVRVSAHIPSSVGTSSGSGAAGSYRIAVEPDNPYSLFAYKSGYEEVVGPTVTLSMGEEYTWNPVLKPLDPLEVDKDSLLGDQSNNVVEPVNPLTGNYYSSKRLFTFPGRKGMGVDFSVHYNSLAAVVDGSIGYGWTHSFNIRVTKQGDVAEVRFPDGHSEYYQWDGISETYTAVNSHPSIVLERVDPEGWKADIGSGFYYHFDGQGRLSQMADLDGNTITLNYSTALDQILDSQDRIIEFIYDSGRLSSITSPLVDGGGNTVEFDYDLSGNLASIIDARGNSWQYGYDTEHRLVTKIDRRGNLVLTNTYDSEGRIASQEDGIGGVTTFDYGETDLGQLVRITNPGQQSFSHQYDKGYNLIEVTDALGLKARFAVGFNGQPLNAVDKQNNTMYFESNERGLVTRIVDRRGIAEDITYNQYHQVTSIVDEFGRTISFSYDENGNLVSEEDRNNNYIKYGVNARGQTDYFKHAAYGGTWDIGYDGNGQATTVTNRYDNTTTYHYDDAGRVIQTDAPDGFGSTTYGYDANGNLLWQESPLGNRTEYTYDESNRMLTRTFVPTDAETSYGYDVMGRLESVTDSMGGVMRYGYDAVGNRVTEEDPEGVLTTFGYDSRNLLISIEKESENTSRYGHDANGNQIWFKNHLGHTVHRSFDAEGWPLSETDALGNTVSYSRNDRNTEVAVTDQLGRKTSYMMDHEGYIKLIRRPGGSFVQFNRNNAGMIISAVDEQGNSWRYDYEFLGRLVEVTDPAGRSETYQYDAVGNLTALSKKDGSVLSWTYDLDRRVTDLDLPGGDSVNWSYTHDAVHGTTTIQVTESAGTTVSVYDRLGRLVSRTDLYANTIEYEYTAGGRLSKVIYPGDNEVSYAYDDYGRLQNINDWQGNTTSYVYDGLDRVIEMVLPNNTRTVYEYDAVDNLRSITHYASDDSEIIAVHYTRDDLGRLVEVKQGGYPNMTTADEETTVTYDQSNRILTSTTGGVVATYVFDENGNLAEKEVGGVTTSYDCDVLDRLIEVTDGVTSTTYLYDHSGRRLAKTFNGVQTRYQREGGHVYTMFDVANTPTAYQVYAGRMLYTLTAAGEILVYHADSRGSIVGVTDASGALTATAAYDPYGNVVGSTGSLDSPFGYVGAFGVLTDDNNLQHMQARYYDPEIGRFLTEDPLGIAAGLNVYTYVAGDPANYIDPRGLAGEVPIIYPECPEGATGDELSDYMDQSPYHQQQQRNESGIDSGSPADIPLPGALQRLQNLKKSGAIMVKHPNLVTAGDLILDASMMGVQAIDSIIGVYVPPARVVTFPVKIGTDVVYTLSTKLWAPMNEKFYTDKYLDKEEIDYLREQQDLRDLLEDAGIDYSDYIKNGGSVMGMPISEGNGEAPIMMTPISADF